MPTVFLAKTVKGYGMGVAGTIGQERELVVCSRGTHFLRETD